VLRPLEWKYHALGLHGLDAHRPVCIPQQCLPLLDGSKTEHDLLSERERLATPVEPDDGLVAFAAQHDHVVVGRDDRLAGPYGVVEDRFITGTPARLCWSVHVRYL
jgi:hypothetical protein